MKSPSPEVAKERDAAYDLIDRFLRNNLDDTDYAEYSAALDTVLASTAAKADLTEEGLAKAVAEWFPDRANQSIYFAAAVFGHPKRASEEWAKTKDQP
jgi:hypothetical protein